MPLRGTLIAIILCLLLLMALTGAWLWTRLIATPPPPSIPPATATPSVPATPTPTPLQAPPGYRLAGVAVGEPDSFAVVEAPKGSNQLYRVNAEVPGLGRLIRIDAERIVVESAAGQFDLWLAPAPTASPTRVRTPAPPPPTARAPGRSPAGGTARGSRP